MIHVLMVMPPDVRSLVLEQPREAPQRIPPRRGESDDHLPPAVERAARLPIVVRAWRANLTTDFGTAAGSDR